MTSVSRWTAEIRGGECLSMIRNQKQRVANATDSILPWHVITGNNVRGNVHEGYLHLRCSSSSYLHDFNADGMWCARSRGCGRLVGNGFRGMGFRTKNRIYSINLAWESWVLDAST